jgi:hypothetical protein
MRIEPGWQDRSKCKSLSGIEADKLFFVSVGRRSKEAKSFCKGLVDGNRCPVFDSCLMSAVIYDHYGIWAATTRRERLRVKPEIKQVIIENAIEDGIYEDFDLDSYIPRRKNKSKVEPVEQTFSITKNVTDILSDVNSLLSSPVLASL